MNPPTVHIPSAGTIRSGRIQSAATPARRARIRQTVDAAAASLAPTWPIERFVATNPLLAFEHLPIERAVAAAAQQLSARTEFDESTYRAWHQSGRITDADLDRALTSRSLDDGASKDSAALSRSTAFSSSTERRIAFLAAEPVVAPAPSPVLETEWLDRAHQSNWAQQIDTHAAWWCAAYLGDHPAWAMPGRDLGLYSAWRRNAIHERRTSRWSPVPLHVVLDELPAAPDDAVMELLVTLGVDRPDHHAYLERHFVRLAGWTASLVRTKRHSDDLLGYLAIRLTLESIVLGDGSRRIDAAAAKASHAGFHTASDTSFDTSFDTTSDAETLSDAAERLAVWRDAYEGHFREQLLGQLTATTAAVPTAVPTAGLTATPRPASHAVFCIDARSEGLRRHLEATGDHATIGYAGFFGLAINVTDLDTDAAVASCPVIVPTQASVIELADPTVPQPEVDRHRRGVSFSHTAHDVFAATKRSAAGPFATAEATGWLAGPLMAARTLAPRFAARALAAARRSITPDIATTVTLGPDWWNADDQLDVAQSILRTTGLDQNPARLVLLCGHGSHHVNNLHRAALDCGACGGRSGANNARVAANLLNTAAVREGLSERGIDVPADTWFVAGEHDTATDQVQLFDLEALPTSHRDDLARLTDDLAVAGAALATERAPSLPTTPGRTASGVTGRRVAGRAEDWAQVIPEWGLAGNAALIVGPRSLTSGVDLQRRAFLHSYETDRDTDAAILTAIMGGPMLVAHWISSQYRMSAVDPDRFGAGTKPAHNLVGGVGVIEGAGGDLRLGLPSESLGRASAQVGSAGAPAHSSMHEAMRLLVIIDAPAERVDQVIDGNEAVRNLVNHGWIHLVARGADHPTNDGWAVRNRDDSWSPWPTPITNIAGDDDLIELIDGAPPKVTRHPQPSFASESTTEPTEVTNA